MTFDITDRDAAWAAVHDPTTDAAALAAIAQAHPEFGPAIAQHPNCYDALRAWVAATSVLAPPVQPREVARSLAVAPVVPTSTPTQVAASAARTSTTAAHPLRARRGLMIGLAAVGGLVVFGGGATWAVLALAGGSAPGSPGVTQEGGGLSSDPNAPRRLAGPPVYIGDELSWFLPETSEVATLFPEAVDVALDSSLPSIGESEGIMAGPERCLPWLMPDISPVVGIRTASWRMPSVGEYSTGRVSAQQFPSTELAQIHFAGYADTLEDCLTFDIVSYPDTVVGRYDLTELGRADDALWVDATSAWNSSDPDTVTVVLALEGNVVVSAFAPRVSGTPSDGEALFERVVDLTATARDRLAEKIGFRE